MHSARLHFLLLIAFILVSVGCQAGTTDNPQGLAVEISDSTAVTSPISPSHTPESTAAPAEAVPVVNTTTPLPSPTVTMTPLPSSTPLPSPTPTETPIPSYPVNSINLIPLIEQAFTKPVYLTHAGDERAFVVEQAGSIRIVRDGRILDDAYLDLRDRVNSSSLEQGLLGLAFHPNYAENGIMVVNYTNAQGNTHISRFTVDPEDPNRADPDSELVLLSLSQPAPNHNGGQVAFGPDGYLYVGVGDGGGANDQFQNGQVPATLLGTILRLDIAPGGDGYNIPASNPFVGVENYRDEIWSWGLRNPWRFSFDRHTGDLLIADVGQNLWEEVNFQPASSTGGENYGWNILEGSHCFTSASCDGDGLVAPVFEYSHQEGCSITGGYIYRGSQYLELYGNYFFGDYCQGKIWRLFQEESGDWSASLVHDSELVISSFGEDADGELYVLDHVNGSLYTIAP